MNTVYNVITSEAQRRRNYRAIDATMSRGQLIFFGVLRLKILEIAMVRAELSAFYFVTFWDPNE